MIDDFSNHVCDCDKVSELCCLEKECKKRIWKIPSELKRHMQQCHLPKIKCLKCPKKFTRKDNMMAHMKKSCKVNKDSEKNKQKRR